MTFRERGLAFSCEGEDLVGVLCDPGDDSIASGIGIVIVVGGPQYRAGSHRQFVLLARALAARGHHCLRFDYRGMGDSTGAARSFEHVGADIHAAIAALRARCPDVRRIMLWGLCDGASAILLYLHEYGAGARTDGLCLANPWVRSADSLAKTHVKHYYAKRLVQKDLWLKMARGHVGLPAIREFVANVRKATRRSPAARQPELSYQQRMAAAWRSYPGPILLLLSGEDYVAREFLDHVQSRPEWSELLRKPGLDRHDLQGVDHTFSKALWRGQAEDLTGSWLARQSDVGIFSRRNEPA